MDKNIIGSGIDYDEINSLPELHIQRKKTPKLLEALTAGLGKEKGLKVFKSEISSLFKGRFTGKSDYDGLKRALARKVFLYNLSRLRTNRPEASESDVPVNFILSKW